MTDPSYRNLGASLEGLGRMLANATRVTLNGVGHTAADNDDQPHRVAAELKQFFAP